MNWILSFRLSGDTHIARMRNVKIETQDARPAVAGLQNGISLDSHSSSFFDTGVSSGVYQCERLGIISLIAPEWTTSLYFRYTEI